MLEKLTVQESSLAHRFFHTVAEHQTRPAQIFKRGEEWVTLTYKELGRIVSELSHGLAGLGIRKGDRVCLIAYSSPEWGWADCAVLAAGGVTVTLYPTYSADEIGRIIGETEAEVVFVQNESILLRMADACCSHMVRHVILMESGLRSAQGKILGLDQLRAIGVEHQGSKNADCLPCTEPLTADDTASIVYSVGENGITRGSLFTHGEILQAAERAVSHIREGGYETTNQDVALSMLPLANLWERCNFYFPMILSGGAVGYSHSPNTILKDVQQIKPTWLLMAPDHWKRIMSGFKGLMTASLDREARFNAAMGIGKKVLKQRSSEDGFIDTTADPTENMGQTVKAAFWRADKEIFFALRTLLGGRAKILCSAGAVLPEELHREYLSMNIPLQNCWSMSDTVTGVNHAYLKQVKAGKLSKMMAGMEVRLAQDGEILLRGGGVINRYVHTEGASVFSPDGWYHTGDIGELDARGFLRILDRKGSIVSVDSGETVVPAGIESMFSQSLLLERVVVFRHPRGFMAALVVPAYDYILYLFRVRGVKYNEDFLRFRLINGLTSCVEVGEDVAGHPMLYELIQEEVDRVNRQLREHEKIHRFAVLPRSLTEAKGELKPTFKVNKKAVLDHFHYMIDKFFA